MRQSIPPSRRFEKIVAGGVAPTVIEPWIGSIRGRCSTDSSGPTDWKNSVLSRAGLPDLPQRDDDNWIRRSRVMPARACGRSVHRRPALARPLQKVRKSRQAGRAPTIWRLNAACSPGAGRRAFAITIHDPRQVGAKAVRSRKHRAVSWFAQSPVRWVTERRVASSSRCRTL